jgi:pimeloyl-ACP methyl ester carboxylesterase
LTVPAGREGRGPLIVLVHGSGPNDRDETIGPNKPFRDIARGLAASGIATLRYDKRTFAFRGMGDARTFTVNEEVIDDAVAAVHFARTLPEVDSTRVFLLGHSLGGTLAPLIAERAPLAGLILLAPGARPLDEAILDQVGTRLRLTGQPEATVTRQVEELRAAFARVRSGAAADSEMVFGAPARYWRDLQARRPLDVLQRLTIPVLVLQGGNDYQVTKADYDLVLAALAARPEASRQTHWFPELNHLFMPVAAPSTGTEYGRAGTVDARVIAAIATWIGSVR